MPAAALVFDRLTRRYPGAARPALDALSLALRPGELVALLGPSGAGKSTALRLAAGYEAPDAGRVLLGDGRAPPRDATHEPPEGRGVGMVFQHYALFPHLTVGENVAFGLEAGGVPSAERRARAAAALGEVGLAGAGPRRVATLSGGEQQRVALARALVVEPGVLLLDEPFSALDPALRARTRDDVRRLLVARGVTGLLVTHDQEDAFAVADRVAVLAAGRLLQVDTPEALYGRPASRAVAEFVGRAALLPARVEGAAVRVEVGGVAQCAPWAGAPGDGDAPNAIGAGGPALAVVRPEHLALLAPGAPDASGAWPGAVVARAFLGASARYTVALAGGGRVAVDGPARGPAVGAPVLVRLGPAPVALVPPEA